jgi:hypothetical protein
MTSRRIGRRQAIQKLGASAMLPALSHFHPAVAPQSGEWKPRFFGESEAETVAQLAERILPETDTPGAKTALVHQYIDFVLSTADPTCAARFREGLEWLDQKSVEVFATPFAKLESPRQDELLTRIYDSPFFQEAKRLSVDGYYRSEVGMHRELGFEGNAFLTEFDGCTHAEHRSWEPKD